MIDANSNDTQQGHYVAANGLEIYYEESGSGTPLILLHGGTMTSQMWQPLISSLAQGFRVITPDSRGHGQTNNPAGELRYDQMADDVAAFVQALGLSKPLICGYSDGGQVALEIGMRYPDLAGALVAGATWYQFSEPYLEALTFNGFAGSGAVNFEQMQDHASDWVEFLKAAHARPNDPDYWQSLLNQISVMWWTPLNYSADDFQKISVPTLILTGDRDGMIPLEEAIDQYQLIPNAELAVIPNADHISATADELFPTIVLDFFSRHASPA